MQFSEAQRLRELESENAKLKRLLAEAHLDMLALKSVLGVKALAPLAKRGAIGTMVSEHHLSERHSCRLVGPSATAIATYRRQIRLPWICTRRSWKSRMCAACKPKRAYRVMAGNALLLPKTLWRPQASRMHTGTVSVRASDTR